MNKVAEVLAAYRLYNVIVCILGKGLHQLDSIAKDVRQMKERQQKSTLVGAR